MKDRLKNKNPKSYTGERFWKQSQMQNIGAKRNHAKDQVSGHCSTELDPAAPGS